jgi:hypothetical protein
MFTGIRSVHAMPGKIGELIPIAKELAAAIKRVSGHQLHVAAAFGGNIAELAWVGTYDSIAQFEDMIAKATADADYRALVQKAAPIVVPGTGRDQFWRHL